MTLITTNAALKAYCDTLTDCPYITVDTGYARAHLLRETVPDSNFGA